MNSTPPNDSDEIPPAGPVLFQAPRPGPGRPPSQTSMSEPPTSSSSRESPTSPGESSTSPEADSWTRHHPDDDEQPPASAPSGDSLGSETGAETPTGLRGSIAAGILNVTEAAHNILADDVGRHFGQFLASDMEIQEISDAGARILSRKLPKGLGNKDLEDALRLGVAFAAYVGRQVKILSQSRAARRQMRAAAAAAPSAGAQTA